LRGVAEGSGRERGVGFPKNENLCDYLMDGRHGDWSGKPDAFDH